MPRVEPRQTWEEVAALLPNVLGRPTDWVVSGSCALAAHGLVVDPKDIDVWCLPQMLSDVAARCGARVELRRIELRPAAEYTLEAFTLRVGGWEVEVVGRVFLPDGIVMTVDAEMLRAASGQPAVESVPDLVAELLTLDRPAPKSDLTRAQLLASVAAPVCRDAIRRRMAMFFVGAERIKAQLAQLARVEPHPDTA